MEHVHVSEQGKLRKAASDGFQAAVWVGFFVMLAVLVVLGIGWGLSQRWSLHAPESLPTLPTLPGKTPEPQPQAPH